MSEVPGIVPAEIQNPTLAEGRFPTLTYSPRRLAAEYVTSVGISLASSGKMEAFAITCGVAAAAANPLVHSDFPTALVALGFSYLGWGYSLYKNGKQAWHLLEETGICQSVMAKAAYDISAVSRVDERILAWTGNSKGLVKSAIRWLAERRMFQKIATGVGFVSLELGKEIPYYAVVFGGEAGVNLVNDALPEGSQLDINTNNGPISFLAGANVGATGWNLGQAGLIHLGRMGINKSEALNRLIGRKQPNSVE